jgi:putative SOS response-associated peptidase YedK
MCGRFALYTDPLALAKRFQTDNAPDWEAGYNVAPSQTIPIVRNEHGARRFSPARWGLIPNWAKDIKIGYGTINARAETVAEKPSFRNAFKHRRCLVPVDGWYEWQEIPGQKSKQPWYISLSDQQPMALAGLWEHWQGSDGSEIESCTIIVTPGNELMQPIHDRMPVILPETTWEQWLDSSNTNAKGLQGLLTQYPSEELVAWPVGLLVNSPKNNSQSCIQPIPAE